MGASVVREVPDREAARRALKGGDVTCEPLSSSNEINSPLPTLDKSCGDLVKAAVATYHDYVFSAPERKVNGVSFQKRNACFPRIEN